MSTVGDDDRRLGMDAPTGKNTTPRPTKNAVGATVATRGEDDSDEIGTRAGAFSTTVSTGKEKHRATRTTGGRKAEERSSLDDAWSVDTRRQEASRCDGGDAAGGTRHGVEAWPGEVAGRQIGHDGGRCRTVSDGAKPYHQGWHNVGGRRGSRATTSYVDHAGGCEVDEGAIGGGDYADECPASVAGTAEARHPQKEYPATCERQKAMSSPMPKMRRDISKAGDDGKKGLQATDKRAESVR
ncbi:hypothetical protein PF010_g16979 [Phytophthora fragariae]|nr:hypothetical protein PF003_g38592 [Phytophthora fragariae]KAE8935545.1 hypothetical protein PF009_g14510 [Phytophthora fragariae]KAE9094740.1 hypothetical protein PF010_g16979 [Phytophthora fragariae]KAE9222296.1 hypothetical protein PF004_g12832 [Phytophthora fragariae]KAE9223173.1 hypothetical protein PF002_g15049 [Phytophthora fragariae]